ncbi:MAG: hypothetical protein M1834_003963 [Cirrosporium novae-zelandiae]|nr:MAG: hypothetical protein M1834_003963 [Cirrosporium novae-zelandiae]
MSHNGRTSRDIISAQLSPDKLKDDRIECLNCGATFQRQKDYLRHLRPYIRCPKRYCSRAYRRDKLVPFLKHIKDEHPELDKDDIDRYLEAAVEAGSIFDISMLQLTVHHVS